LRGNDVILCQITSRTVTDDYAVPIADADFASGSLRQDSNVRPNRLFTAASDIILYKAGTLSLTKTEAVTRKIVEIVTQ
jgi:mRNA interferase MazF